MKKLIISLVLSILVTLPVACFSMANADVDIVPSCGAGSTATVNGIPNSSSVCSDVHSLGKGANDPVIGIIKDVIIIISYVTGVAATILILLSGIKFMTASGDPAKISSARGTLVYALIGIIITVLGQLIVAFVLDNIS